MMWSCIRKTTLQKICNPQLWTSVTSFILSYFCENRLLQYWLFPYTKLLNSKVTLIQRDHIEYALWGLNMGRCHIDENLRKKIIDRGQACTKSCVCLLDVIGWRYIHYSAHAAYWAPSNGKEGNLGFREKTDDNGVTKRWDFSNKGRWPHRLIPKIGAWFERRHEEVNNYLKQFLTGLGCFRAYL